MIGATALDELLTADPHNVVRLILPARSPDDADPAAQTRGTEGTGAAGTAAPGAGPAGPRDAGDANARAARRLHGWLAAGILAPDPEPSLYVYEQRGPAQPGAGQGAVSWVQRGLIALVAVGDPQSAGILPHEDVMGGPVRDRRDLMAATRSNLEPIFLVYDADDGMPSCRRSRTSQIVDLVAESRPLVVTAVTKDGITHRLWRLADPAWHAVIAADLATRDALIADGHHRYAAYRELRDQMHAAGHGSGPWDYGLAYIVDAEAYPPRLGAIHRVIPGLREADATQLAARSFHVQALGTADLDQALGYLAKAGQGGPAFLLACQSDAAAGDHAGREAQAQGTPLARYWLLTSPDQARRDAVMPAHASPAWRDLDAAILQRLLLADAWGIQDNDRDVPVFHDAAEAVSAAISSGGTAVISNPVPFAAVTEIARHGERVPRKSTSFGPKPRSGLVLRLFFPGGHTPAPQALRPAGFPA